MYRLFTSLLLMLVILQVWIKNSDAASAGRYRASGNEGKYVPDEDKWAYRPDNRGKYVHVHIPYNGGYGPFRNPYEHDGRAYEHDERTHVDDPFQVNFFNDKRPAVYREYGAPLFGQL